ncbi:MAG: class I SAM-dependent methyltransferase [Acidobacteriaceae bacterium]
MPEIKTCPNCLKGDLAVFYEVPRVPVHSVLQMPTREVAVNFPKGDIALGKCSYCGFIANTVFDPTVHNYSADYEETQGFSGTFQAFHHRLASELIDKYDLHGKKIIEIGCGKGEFLSLICEMGKNSGVGFDPAFVSARKPSSAETDIEFVADFYGEKYAHVQGDFVCCKMTLEHIPDTANFVSTVRRSVGDRYDSVVFFQVPDMHRVLRDLAFWDIYYEHCSYFTADSLSLLFRQCGFDILEVWTDYDDQYLMISTKPSRTPATFVEKPDSTALDQEIEFFTRNQKERMASWKSKLEQTVSNGKRAVIWGSGSKGVAFLTALKLYTPDSEIEYVVDINPFREGKYMAGTGQEIVSPAFLKRYRPDLAIAMNPIYQPEIKADLEKMGLSTEVVAV